MRYLVLEVHESHSEKVLRALDEGTGSELAVSKDPPNFTCIIKYFVCTVMCSFVACFCKSLAVRRSVTFLTCPECVLSIISRNSGTSLLRVSFRASEETGALYTLFVD